MAEIRDGTVKKVLEKLRGLSDDIEEINRRFDTVDRTGDTLEDLRVRVYHQENEMTNLKRQVERGSVPLPPQNQQAGSDRFPIPMYSGECNNLSRFLKLFYTWALSHKSEDTLSYSRPVLMTSKKSRPMRGNAMGWYYHHKWDGDGMGWDGSRNFVPITSYHPITITVICTTHQLPVGGMSALY